jgi:N utilization substance protein B
MTRRTRGREIALQVLYMQEVNPDVDPAEILRFVQRRLREPELRAFALRLVDGVKKNRAAIDRNISEVAENWRIDRMADIDRNILRLGAFEILFHAQTPKKVAINEALELAKRYSTSHSSRFVNGILDRLAPAPPQEPEPPADPEPQA